VLENRHRSLSDTPPSEPRLVRSQHFAFMTDVSDREWAVIRDKLERMVGVLERFFGRKARGMVEGFIVRDLAAWPKGLLEEPLGVEKIRRREGVCFNTSLGPARRAVLYACADHGVIQHECVHGFCHLTFGSTGPTWLSEGVAELGNSWRDGDDAVAIDPLVMGYLQNAPRKRTLGEIAVPGQEPAGSWQDYAWRWALCYLLANNPNYSDRFRPLAVALMEQRPGASFEATYGPVAREVSFEYDRLLETVGNGYRADLTAWPWKAAFRTLAPGGSQKTRIKAAAGWHLRGGRRGDLADGAGGRAALRRRRCDRARPARGHDLQRLRARTRVPGRSRAGVHRDRRWPALPAVRRRLDAARRQRRPARRHDPPPLTRRRGISPRTAARCRTRAWSWPGCRAAPCCHRRARAG
jgi:hypothetical protein